LYELICHHKLNKFKYIKPAQNIDPTYQNLFDNNIARWAKPEKSRAGHEYFLTFVL
jgi:hypothetical protein